MGYSFCDDESQADFIIFNTCSVRDHAEQRVYSNIGALKKLKQTKPSLLIAICGCMPAQEKVAKFIRSHFPYVDIIVGTNAIHKLPSLINEAKAGRIMETTQDDSVYEGVPLERDSQFKASVSIMYGCDNYCTYCIVPYVRGRERSREPHDIIAEVENLAKTGCKEINLLGQNVNSYGKGLVKPYTFTQLLRDLSHIDGVKRIRFISSHPKDISDELIAEMAANDKVCKQLHLPFQSGSDKVLADMNRRYTSAQYKETIRKLRDVMPNIFLSSDVIVGFPTEEQEDFDQTLRLLEEVRFDQLFTFIYSKRSGTKAADMPIQLPTERIKANFTKLLDTQLDISLQRNKALISTTQQVLVESKGKSEGQLCGKTNGGRMVNIDSGSESLIGKLVDVQIYDANAICLFGTI